MYFIFTTLLLENKGSDTAKGVSGFQIPLRTWDFFSFGWRAVQTVYIYIYYIYIYILIILFHECLEVAVFHFVGISFPHFCFPL